MSAALAALPGAACRRGHLAREACRRRTRRSGRVARHLLLALAAALLLAPPLHAQPAPAPEAGTATAPLWELGLGLGGLQLPHYRGSEQSHSWLLPLPYLVYRGQFLKADREGTRAVLFNSDHLDFDLSLAASAPTRSRENRARAGMADLAPTLEFGPNLNLTLARSRDWKLDLRLPVRAGFTVEREPRHVGLSASPNLNLDLRLGSWNLGLQAGPQWADRRRHAFVYDVTGADVTATRPAFRSQAGWAGWTGTLALSRRSGNAWLGAFVRGDSLAGADIAASPLVTARHTWSAGVAMAWVLKASETRVRVSDGPDARDARDARGTPGTPGTPGTVPASGR